MRRNRKNNLKRERILMIASSAFVLAALTMAGIYTKEQSAEKEDKGYTLDFAALENDTEDKNGEIAMQQAKRQETVQEEQTNLSLQQPQVTENDLDYVPMEAGSSLIEIPGVTDQETLNGEALNGETLTGEALAGEALPGEQEAQMGSQAPDASGQEAEAADNKAKQTSTTTKSLNFSEEQGLVRPIEGEILMHYSMDGSIYFATLDQYKYNPAVIFSAVEGERVKACAEGKVVSVFEEEEIGTAVVLELGNGYQATYGQLQDVTVKEGSYVNAGDDLGCVAAPTKYYSTEGYNLYFRLDKETAPVNPEELFQE